MLAVVIDRGHGVASLTDGELEVMQHRRGAPYVEDAAAEPVEEEPAAPVEDAAAVPVEEAAAVEADAAASDGEQT